MCDCCDPTADSPDPVVVRLEAEVERWKLNVADAQGRIRELHDDNTIMRGLLREACEYAKADESDWKAWYPRFIPEDWCDRAQAALEGKP